MRDINTPLTFGKYKGRTLAEISKLNPEYVVWIHDHLTIRIVPDTLYDSCKIVAMDIDRENGEWDHWDPPND
jgi:hypothetical protein